jgi:hypothetical protein
LETDSCGTSSPGTGAKAVAENSDSVEQSLLYPVGAVIESIDYRGRAAPSAPRESCLARNAGLQGPLFHGSARSIGVFSKQTFFTRESSFPAIAESRALSESRFKLHRYPQILQDAKSAYLG